MIIHKSHGGGVAGLIERMNNLGKTEVYIGIPQKENARNGDSNNATIASVHELGAPSKGIPARPFLIPTISKNKQKYVDLMAQGFRNALNNKTSPDDVYEKIGLVASGDVKEYIVNGDFKALSQKTIDRKGSSKPLVDTGEMRNSISWEVRK